MLPRYKRMVRAALFTALLAVLSQISIPMPSSVPVTLQIFAVALCGGCLGSLYGSVSAFAYLALGAVGVPVFSGFSGGVSALLSYTGGFPLSFPALAVLCSVAARQKKKAGGILFSLVGLSACHLLGVLWYSAVGEVSFLQAFLVASVPYLGKDAALVLAALYTSSYLKRRGIV